MPPPAILSRTAEPLVWALVLAEAALGLWLTGGYWPRAARRVASRERRSRFNGHLVFGEVTADPATRKITTMRNKHVPFSMTTAHWLTLGIASFCIAPVVAVDMQSPGTTVTQRVLADWERRQSFCARVSYYARGERTIPAGAWTEFVIGVTGMPFNHPVPRSDTNHNTSIRLMLDLDRNWCRKEVHQPVLEDLAQFATATPFTIQLCDGKQRQTFRPKEYNPELAEDTVLPYELHIHPSNAPFFEPSNYPLLFAHGLFFSVSATNLRKSGLKHVPPLQEHGHGLIDGREHVILRTGPLTTNATNQSWHMEFWVDLDRQSAVSRWRQIENGHVVKSFDAEFQQTDAGWLPSSWRFDEFSNGTVFESSRYFVTKVDVSPSFKQSMFRISPAAGMVVQNNINKRVVVSGGPDGEDVDINIALARQHSGRALRRRLIIAALAASGVVAIAIVWLRRMRKR